MPPDPSSLAWLLAYAFSTVVCPLGQYGQSYAYTCLLQCSSASRSQARPNNTDVIFMSTCSIPLFTKFVKQLEWPYLHIYHNLPVQWWCTISYSAQHYSNVEIEPAKLSQKLEQAFIVLMGSQKGAEIHLSVLLRSSLDTSNPRALGWHVADFFRKWVS